MKALSIRQPWAWLIVAGYKDIENRTWPTAYRGRVLVHAGARLADDYDRAEEMCRRMGITIPANLPMGGFVGAVEIIDCVKASASPWFFGPYGFILAGAFTLPFVPYRGEPKIFDVPDLDESIAGHPF